jgi:hypothetical protein
MDFILNYFGLKEIHNLWKADFANAKAIKLLF